MDPKPLRGLLRASVALIKESALQAAAILAAGLCPTALLLAVAYWATGLTSQDAVNEAIRSAETARLTPLIAANLVKILADTLVFIALVLAIEARQARRPLTLRQAYASALERFGPFLATAARAAAHILGGLLLLVVPGVLLAARYSLAQLAVLLEGLTSAAALKRSSALVRAEPWRAVGLLAAATASALALNAAAAVVVAAFVSLGAVFGAVPIGAIEGQLQALLSQLLSGLVGAWLIGFSVLLYRDLASRHPLTA